jgi:pilus assembly protein FimV
MGKGSCVNKFFLKYFIFLIMFFTSDIFALDLGGIELNSTANEPLNARINILLIDGNIQDIKQLKVKVAPRAVFKRVGIEWSDYLETFKFSLNVDNKEMVIMIDSIKPMDQPSLIFLLEVSWSEGKLLKEYKIQMAFPVDNEVIISNEVNSSKEATNLLFAKEKIVKKRVVEDIYHVVKGDTLFVVAAKLQRQSVHHKKMMAAIFHYNPQAFQEGDINHLKEGSLLQRPSNEEIDQLTEKKNKPVQAIILGKNLDEINKKIEKLESFFFTINTKENSNKLHLLKNDLIKTNEFLMLKTNKNIQLQSRVLTLKSLLREKNRLVLLKHEELNKVHQDKVKKASPINIDQSATYEVDRWVDLIEKAKEKNNLPKKEFEIGVTSLTNANEKNESNILSLSLFLKISGVFILMMLMFFLIRANNKIKVLSDFKRKNKEGIGKDNSSSVKINKKEKGKKSVVTKIHSDKTLQDADVFIIYGLYDQAENELKRLIKKDPSNVYYHAKLLENYQAASNTEAFNEQVKIFLKLDDDQEGNKKSLWKGIIESTKNSKFESCLSENFKNDVTFSVGKAIAENPQNIALHKQNITALHLKFNKKSELNKILPENSSYLPKKT